jgi:hypothetical protein
MKVDDWRLQGQEKYLLGATLYFKKYKDRITTTDHDHCEFCFKKFSDEIPDALTEGYTTQQDYRWICQECYQDFNDVFKWHVESI